MGRDASLFMGHLKWKCAKRAMCQRRDFSCCHRSVLVEAEVDDGLAALVVGSSQLSLDDHHHHQRQVHLGRAEQLNGRLMSVPETEARSSEAESGTTRLNLKLRQQVRGSIGAVKLAATKANNMCLVKMVHLRVVRVTKSRLNSYKLGRHKCSIPKPTTISKVLLPRLMLLLVLMTAVATASASTNVYPSSRLARSSSNFAIVNRPSDSSENQRLDTDQIKMPKWPSELQERLTKRHVARGPASRTLRHRRKRHNVHPSGQQLQHDRPFGCASRHRIMSLTKNLEGDANELHPRWSEVAGPEGGLFSLKGPEFNGHDQAVRKRHKSSSKRLPTRRPYLNETPEDRLYRGGFRSPKSRRSSMRGQNIAKYIEDELFASSIDRPETASQSNQTAISIELAASSTEPTETNDSISHFETQSTSNKTEAPSGESSSIAVANDRAGDMSTELISDEASSGSTLNPVGSNSEPETQSASNKTDAPSGENSSIPVSNDKAGYLSTELIPDEAGFGDVISPVRANSEDSDDDSDRGEELDDTPYGEEFGDEKCDALDRALSGRPPPIAGLIFAINYSIVFVLGLVGNVITLYVLMCKGKKRTAQDILIGNLACGDIMMCVFVVPITPKYVILDGAWVMGPVLCKAGSFAMSTSVYMSTYSLICIGYIRYRLIVHPLEVAMSKRKALFTCLATWLFAIMVTLPYTMKIKLTPAHCDVQYCSEAWEKPYRSIFSVFTTVFQFTIPLLSVIFFNKKIYSRLDGRRQGSGGAGAGADHGGVQNDQATADHNGGAQPPSSGANSNSQSHSHSHKRVAIDIKQKLHNSLDHLHLFGSTQAGAHDTPTSGGGAAGALRQHQHQHLQARAPDVLAIREQRQREKERRMRKANNRLIFVVVIFAHSWLPLNLFNLTQDLTELMTDWPYMTTVFLTTHIIASSSVIWNPILYAWMSETYRQDLRCALPRFVVAKLSSLLAEPSTTSGHRTTNTDCHGHHQTHSSHHQQQRQVVPLQHSSNKSQTPVPPNSNGTRRGSHELFAPTETSIKISAGEYLQSNGVATMRAAIQMDNCSDKLVASDEEKEQQQQQHQQYQQHQQHVGESDLGLAPICVSAEGTINAQCCDSIGHLYDYATSGSKFDQSSEIASEDMHGVCCHYDIEDGDGDENACDRVHSSIESCSGCRNWPLQPSAVSMNGHENTAEVEAPQELDLRSSANSPSSEHANCSGPPQAQLVNPNETATTATRLRHQRSIEVTSSIRASNSNSQSLDVHQQQSDRRRLQRRTSCCSSMMGETLSIVV